MIEFSAVIKEVRRTAIRNPLNRNPELGYFNEDGSPCCVFGHALNSLGIDRLGFFQNQYPAMSLDWDGMGFEEPDDYDAMWITQMQGLADSGKRWLPAMLLTDWTLVRR